MQRGTKTLWRTLKSKNFPNHLSWKVNGAAATYESAPFPHEFEKSNINRTPNLDIVGRIRLSKGKQALLLWSFRIRGISVGLAGPEL